MNFSNIDKSWENIFNEYNEKFPSINLNVIFQNIKNNNNIFPKNDNIFKCFEYFKFEETKIVLLGQDPYHGDNQAMGLCFGINDNIKIPPSLKNIIKELKDDTNIELTDLSLEKWAKQKILMLNSSLTVIKGKPNSHIKLWDNFTKFIINKLNNSNNKIIFVAWGAYAHKKFENINLNKHELIISSHPSPLSVYKKYNIYPSFSGSKPFSKINNILKLNNNTTIDW